METHPSVAELGHQVCVTLGARDGIQDLSVAACTTQLLQLDQPKSRAPHSTDHQLDQGRTQQTTDQAAVPCKQGHPN